MRTQVGIIGAGPAGLRYGRLQFAGDAAHIVPPTGAEPMDERLQPAQLRHLVTSRATAKDLAGNYVGLPFAA